MKNRIISVIMLAFLGLSLVSCGSKTAGTKETGEAKTTTEGTYYSEDNAKRKIAEGLQERWKISTADSTLLEYPTIQTAAIDAELSMISELKDKEYEDVAFRDIISSYIDASSNQKEALQYFFTDSQTYTQLYYTEGYQVRQETIQKLVDNYNFIVDNDYKSNLDQLLNDEVVNHRISFGETVTVSNSYGSFDITIDSIELSDWAQLENPSDNSITTVLVLADIKNKDFNDGNNGLFLDNVMSVFDNNNYMINSASTGYDHGLYQAMGVVPVGANMKVAFPYTMGTDNQALYLNLGNQYELVLKLQQ